MLSHAGRGWHTSGTPPATLYDTAGTTDRPRLCWGVGALTLPPSRTPADLLIGAHFGLGIDIRRDFGLWDGNDELLASCGEQHPDDAAGAIVEETWPTPQE